MESWEGAQLNQAKEILAFELTKLVHGEEEASKAREASHALFAGGGDSAHMPTVELSSADFADGDMDILSLLVKSRARSIPFRRKTCRRTGRCLSCRRESNRYQDRLQCRFLRRRWTCCKTW